MHSPAISRIVPEAASVSPAATQELAREYHAFAKYLLGVEATAYQVEKYVDYHRRHRLESGGPFDALLYRAATANQAGLRLADAYSGTLFRKSLLRSKLVLVLSILESSAPSFRQLDDPGPQPLGGLGTTALRLIGAVGVFALALPVFAPFHLWHALRSRDTR